MNVLIVDDELMMLEMAKDTVEEVVPDSSVETSFDPCRALEMAQKKKYDVALLDIEMPEMTGLELAKKLKMIDSHINIIFVTAYAEYALEAFELYASGYLMKPLNRESVQNAFANLRHEPKGESALLRVQCFGNFEVFYKNEPVAFARAREKEIFAYLVDLRGAAANVGELCAILWEDSVEQEKNKHYMRNLISDIRKTLHDCKADNVFISKRNQYAVDPTKLDCDYYRYLENDVQAKAAYQGEYMKQYSWAEFSMIR